MHPKLFSTASLLYLFTVGCGSDADVELLEVAPVSGSVRIDGHPAQGVALNFIPLGATRGTGGFATSQPDGQFTAISHDGREGLPPGEYQVLLSQWRMPDGSPIPEDTTAADAGAVNRLPEIYSSPGDSPQTVQVMAGVNAPVTLEVKSAKPGRSLARR